MKNLLSVVFVIGSTFLLNSQSVNKLKKDLLNSIEEKTLELTSLSDKIWEAAEVAFREDKSAEYLIEYAEANGLTIERGLAGMPTAFTASYGKGKPVIGIIGEFDALPGLSQSTAPYRDELIEGGAGHGCGHNLFGTASLGAAIAIKELIEKGSIEGTVKFFGTPAEEKFFGKLWMIREGVFDDVDICMDWHPADKTEANVQPSLALVDFMVEFTGQSAHASMDPWNARAANDALELYTSGINAYREHVKPSVRMHYHIQDAGQVVNVVPDYSRIWVRVRDITKEGLQPVYDHVRKMAGGAAIMANVEHKVSLISGIHDLLPNRTGGAAMQKNLEALGDVQYTQQEIDFALEMQRNNGKPEIGIDGKIRSLRETLKSPGGGSTDVGDVSYNVPVVSLNVTTAPKGVPWHSWSVVASSGMSIGHKGMLYAAKALGMTMVDIFKDSRLRDDIKREFDERIGEYEYDPFLDPGPPPLDYVD
ncbi:amidohydrolase [Flavobacteriaceae bacterium]|nr:amidohydrolase [Flavobacteriaceae bacterium]